MELEQIEKYRCPDGSIYTGGVKRNGEMIEFTGKGEIFYPNGDSYSGWFKYGQVNGFGKYQFSDGDIHSGWFLNGIPYGLGYLKHHSSMALVFFKEGKLNGWGIQINSAGLFHFGWWNNNQLIQNETTHVQWIRTQLNEKMNIYKGDLVHIFDKQGIILFGFLQMTRKSIFDNSEFIQPPMGFLFDNQGNLMVGDRFYSGTNGWFVRYTSNRKIVYGYWKNGVLEREGNLSNFQQDEDQFELLPF